MSRSHRHPGPVSGYLLEGKFEFQVEGRAMKILKTVDSFLEPRMILHMRRRNPDKMHRARVLATIVHPTSVPSIVILEPAKIGA